MTNLCMFVYSIRMVLCIVSIVIFAMNTQFLVRLSSIQRFARRRDMQQCVLSLQVHVD